MINELSSYVMLILMKSTNSLTVSYYQPDRNKLIHILNYCFQVSHSYNIFHLSLYVHEVARHILDNKSTTALKKTSPTFCATVITTY